MVHGSLCLSDGVWLFAIEALRDGYLGNNQNLHHLLEDQMVQTWTFHAERWSSGIAVIGSSSVIEVYI